MNPTVHKLLENEYHKLSNNEDSSRIINIFNNIIEIKFDNRDSLNYHQHISKDVKAFLSAYVLISETERYKYDKIKFIRIEEILFELDYDLRMHSVEYFIRKLKVEGLDSQIKEAQKMKNSFVIKNCVKSPFTFSKCYSFLITFPFYNTLTLIMTLSIIYLIFFIFTLPAFSDKLVFYKLNYVQYSNHFIYNHFLNITSDIVGIKTDFKITPINQQGIMLSIFSKLLFYIFVVNSLIAKLLDITKR